MTELVTVVPGEAAESDSEEEIDTADTIASRVSAPKGVVVQGEASETESEEEDEGTATVTDTFQGQSPITPLKVDSLPSSPKHDQATEKIPVPPPKYDTLLHRKLRDRNIGLQDDICEAAGEAFHYAIRELNTTNQMLAKSQTVIQPGRRTHRTVPSPTERRPWSSPSKNRSNTTVISAGSSRSTLDQTPKIQNWLCHKSVRGVQERADPESKNTKKMYMAVLDRENTFVRDVENELLHKTFLDQRKKEMLYKKWSEQIFEPIQEKIYRAMKGNYAAVDRKKRQLFNEYIHHRNKKGYVFLDTFDEKEYDPLSLVVPRPAPIRATTGALNDPLIAQRRERNDEDRTVIRCYTGQSMSDRAVEQSRLPPLPLVPLGRHGTECRTWLAMPLHDIESPVRLQSRRRMKGIFNECHFDFKDWPSFSADPSTATATATRTSMTPPTTLDAQVESLIAGTPVEENKSLALVT